MDYLTKDNFLKDLKEKDINEIDDTAEDIRKFLLDNISKTGGHLSSNLGVVELTLALHYVFDSPRDKFIWDVGHQVYVHKILTGRTEGFKTLRKFKGMSGFPKIKESEHDTFDTGHSGTSISLALGYAKARDLNNDDFDVIPIIGDGAMTGGISYEAMNSLKSLDSKIILVLNDNGMSISPNSSGISYYLKKLRASVKYKHAKTSVKKGAIKVPILGNAFVSIVSFVKSILRYNLIKDVFFENMGFTYIGPVDGHNIRDLVEAFEIAKLSEDSVIIHCITKKGKGYKIAEENPDKYHGVSPFDIQTGKKKPNSTETFAEIAGEILINEAEKNEKLLAISAAMIDGTGLNKFAKRFKDRIFDVGIAEAHAVTLSAGLAKEGFNPVVCIYSTFLQRAYDHIIEDICLSKYPVTFFIDRAGAVGEDGETHHGIFDISYINTIPNITLLAPATKEDFEIMYQYSKTLKSPCAIRYPRGECKSDKTISISEKNQEIIPYINHRGNDVLILPVGKMLFQAEDALDILKEKNIGATVCNLGLIKPINKKYLNNLVKEYRYVVTIEDNVVSGGFGEKISSIVENPTLILGWPDKFIEHGDISNLFEKYRLDAKGISERIIEFVKV